MSKDSEVGSGLTVIHPAQVLVMSRALNEALKAGGPRSPASGCSQPGGRAEPGTKGYRVAGALEVGGVESHSRGRGSRVGDCIRAGSGWDHSSSDVS